MRIRSFARSRALRALAAGLVLAGIAFYAVAVPKGRALRKAIAALPEVYQQFLEEVDPLLDREELKEFLALEKDYQRDAFIERFWEARDPYPDSARNEYRDQWYARLDYAREEWGNVAEDRARMFLLNGQPAVREQGECRLVWPLEVWQFVETDQLPFAVHLLFYQPQAAGDYRLWRPSDGVYRLIALPPLLFRDECKAVGVDVADNPLGVVPGQGSRLDDPEAECLLLLLESKCRLYFDPRAFRSALARALGEGPQGFDILLFRLEDRPKPREGEWLDSFAAYSTDLPEGAAELAATVSTTFPGKDSFRTVVQTVISVPEEAALAVELAGRRSYNFQLTGEVLKDGELFEGFRYKFDQPAVELAGETIPLVFQRFLRPASYRLVMKLEDLASHAYFRYEGALEVPKVEEDLPAPAPEDPRSAALWEEASRALSPHESGIRLVVPEDEVLTGMVRFDTLVKGEGFDKVTFLLNGKAVLTKKRPPYSVELDLGRVPRTHSVRVAAYDEAGQEVGADEIEVNSGKQSFAVRLIEPQRHKTYQRSLLARAAVDAPEGQTVERVEIYLDETLLATLYQPPFAQPIVLEEGGALAYVRAVAYLADGSSTEDVVFVNAPDYLEEVDIQLVELYATVLDGEGRPVAGLSAGDFQVIEDGQPQSIRRFETVSDRPIRAGILLDTSSSMEKRIERARDAALGFFQKIITPKDRASVVTFNDRPHLAVELTNDIQALAAEMAGLKAEGGTSLWDSVVFNLYYFNGLSGQRAILLLSDGKDEGSRHSFEEALGYAQAAGVTFYTIGLDLPRTDLSRRLLTKLAEQTGGRSFFVKNPEELGAVYDRIQKELRSQYLIAYQSTNTAGGGAFRTVEVRVPGGDEVKTLRGYYP